MHYNFGIFAQPSHQRKSMKVNTASSTEQNRLTAMEAFASHMKEQMRDSRLQSQYQAICEAAFDLRCIRAKLPNQIDKTTVERLNSALFDIEHLGRLRAALRTVIDFRNSQAGSRSILVDFIDHHQEYECDLSPIRKTITNYWPHVQQKFRDLPVQESFFHCELQMLSNFVMSRHPNL
jgi:hypothetical protein